jgi:hypothetical protein
MHQTTVRFGADLWDALEDECARLGMSIAQYLREAALTRLVYAAGRRGDEEFEFALDLATGSESLPPEGSDAAHLEAIAGRAWNPDSVRERALREGSEAAALGAQAQLARDRARDVRARLVRRRSG